MLFISLILLIAGIIIAESGKPDMWEINHQTKERTDPLTIRENIGFTMISISFIIFLIYGINLLF